MSVALQRAREGGVLACFIDWRNIASVIDAVQIAGWVYRGIVPWYKGADQRPNKGWFRRNIEYIVTGSLGPLDTGQNSDEACFDGLISARVNGVEKLHQTGKPLELMSAFIALRSDWQTILDPFMGSGTTLRAAKDLGRRCVGIEIQERDCEIAAERCRQEVLDLGAA
jgi:site-specific DNA-methyltransferase (adenine-specific)